ncbi:hypothetical protein CHS0354_024177 [Potamilus streckersoni]|uniref:DNA repair protein RecN n=1 Tax=Potamilus streckersoni TaxID=2493646 RepID=A0AAE0RZZ7_9BIVA|nr:hypothetical protein CHS0354_024177 [Potamilus streckersoni]
MQLKEINSLNPQPNEIETLLTEEKILENSEALLRDTTKLDEILYGDDNSIHNQLFASHLLDCRSVIDDVNQHVQSYQSKIEFNPIHLEELRERSVALNQLRKKYGGSLEQVLAYKEKIEKEVSLVENFDEEIAKLKNEIANIRLRLNERALQLSFKRQEVASQLSHLIELKLKELGIANSTFHVDFKKSENINGDVSFEGKTYEVNASGLDTIEFLISTNIGESLKPLIKVASGGEISRIMLAIKSILAKSSQLPVLVFDEIDTGISGKIAQAVGFSLKKLSNYHQLIVITHLPQVAAMKETHFRVEKSIQGERTYTTVKQLSDAEHEAEVATLLAGATITEASLRSAKELIHASRNI